ncbi:MAG: hypothetical protein AMJ69_01850 [Gammaproteobacteria bacterium SG8_47]|nr:MAG: hypothetical protein AMJ69_01850 [Gammaproteobacteria bacterium SG8_47]
MPGYRQRALQWSALCVWVLVSLAAVAGQDQACSVSGYDAVVRVEHVFDGDTVRLEDGRKLRLMGINTPELHPPGYAQRANAAAEPLAERARDALAELLGESRRLHLVLGTEREDRYGRLLAHAYLPDGGNVAGRLLASGLGFAIVVPPNTNLADCYVRSEQLARGSKRGVWGEDYFAPVPATEITASTAGFRLISATIQSVSRRGDTTWLKLSNVLSLRIRDADLAYFQGIDLASWRGREVLARGWLTPRGGRVSVRIRHPSALELTR